LRQFKKASGLDTSFETQAHFVAYIAGKYQKRQIKSSVILLMIVSQRKKKNNSRSIALTFLRGQHSHVFRIEKVGRHEVVEEVVVGVVVEEGAVEEAAVAKKAASLLQDPRNRVERSANAPSSDGGPDTGVRGQAIPTIAPSKKAKTDATS